MADEQQNTQQQGEPNQQSEPNQQGEPQPTPPQNQQPEILQARDESLEVPLREAESAYQGHDEE